MIPPQGPSVCHSVDDVALTGESAELLNRHGPLQVHAVNGVPCEDVKDALELVANERCVPKASCSPAVLRHVSFDDNVVVAHHADQGTSGSDVRGCRPPPQTEVLAPTTTAVLDPMEVKRPRKTHFVCC